MAFRLVAEVRKTGDAGVDMLPAPREGGQAKSLAVRREVLLDEKDVAELAATALGDTYERVGISMTLTPAGARKLHEVSLAHRDRRLAIVLDGQVLIAATIREALPEHMVIDLGEDRDEIARADVAGRLHAAVFALSPRQPASGPSAK